MNLTATKSLGSWRSPQSSTIMPGLLAQVKRESIVAALCDQANKQLALKSQGGFAQVEVERLKERPGASPPTLTVC